MAGVRDRFTREVEQPEQEQAPDPQIEHAERLQANARRHREEQARAQEQFRARVAAALADAEPEEIVRVKNMVSLANGYSAADIASGEAFAEALRTIRE